MAPPVRSVEETRPGRSHGGRLHAGGRASARCPSGQPARLPIWFLSPGLCVRDGAERPSPRSQLSSRHGHGHGPPKTPFPLPPPSPPPAKAAAPTLRLPPTPSITGPEFSYLVQLGSPPSRRSPPSLRAERKSHAVT